MVCGSIEVEVGGVVSVTVGSSESGYRVTQPLPLLPLPPLLQLLPLLPMLALLPPLLQLRLCTNTYHYLIVPGYYT